MNDQTLLCYVDTIDIQSGGNKEKAAYHNIVFHTLTIEISFWVEPVTGHSSSKMSQCSIQTDRLRQMVMESPSLSVGPLKISLSMSSAVDDCLNFFRG